MNRDIHAVVDAAEAGEFEFPEMDMVVGGYPCQDYSIARPLSASGGIEGDKGVLWWEVWRLLRLKAGRECRRLWLSAAQAARVHLRGA